MQISEKGEGRAFLFLVIPIVHTESFLCSYDKLDVHLPYPCSLISFPLHFS